MMTNDDTQLMGMNPQKENTQTVHDGFYGEDEPQKKSGTWKKVALGSTAGILLGAGALYASRSMAANTSEDADAKGAEGQQAAGTKVANVDDGMSFDDAFQAARAQVGPGGVFEWHGGVYGTYTQDEWNAMSDEEKSAFTETAMSHVQPHDYHAPQTAVHHEDVIVHETVVREEVAQQATPTHKEATPGGTTDNHYRTVSHDEPYIQESDDVHVVGKATVHGHDAYAVDLDGDGQADVAVIDVNDNGRLDDPDVVMLPSGDAMTMGQLAQARDADATGGEAGNDSGEPDHTDGYMRTSYNGTTGEEDVHIEDDGLGGHEQDVDYTGEQPVYQQASYSEDMDSAVGEGMMDPNLHQASFTEDPGMVAEDPTVGTDSMDDANRDVQYI